MAGRIPQKFLDDLLDRLDIVDVIDRRVKLRKTGKNYSACCPFHDEKTPSFSVNPEKQFFYCFGCGAGGNAIGFVMDYEKLDFPEAVENLAQSAGLEVPREEARPGSAANSADSNKPLYESLEQSAQFYERSLRQHPAAGSAVDYLKSRGLTGEIAKAFRLGYAPPGWDNLIAACGQSEAEQERLLKCGMLIKNDRDRVYDRFRERVIFPILDQRGRVIAFGGRVLGDDKPKYLNSPETPVFHKSRELYGLYQARKYNNRLERIVVVEGYMDVIALAQHGIGYAVATLGTATSEAHLERLYRLVPEVIFCFDGDDAGRKAAFRALESALPVMQDGRQARFLFLDEGEDPDTLVRKKGRDFIEARFNGAAPLETYLFDHLSEAMDVATMDGRARLSKLAAPFLQRLPDGVFKELMYQDLARRTGIDLDSLKRLQAPPPTPEQRPTSGPVMAESELTPPPFDAPPLEDGDWEPTGQQFDEAESNAERTGPALDPRVHSAVQRLLGLTVLKPVLAKDLDTGELVDGSHEDLTLLRELANHIHENPQISSAALLGYWYGTSDGQRLADYSGRETLIEDAGLDALFTGLLDQVRNHRQAVSLNERLRALKAKPFADLDTDEKQELMAITRQLRTLKGRS
ncbi:DNA primase [Luminiphilus syltensis NOR5-1B]|uniref:DNA primase n=1 Tax=Luminiphilus syltensis NOR5-1B TaxID=565045 RepID=B8KVX2_9GAMM|nr:DNA primase [Luminiphilus syltensis]EED34464.1 DNA primase [Luminiphilus syltensis NOR5-1B]